MHLNPVQSDQAEKQLIGEFQAKIRSDYANSMANQVSSCAVIWSEVCKQKKKWTFTTQTGISRDNWPVYFFFVCHSISWVWQFFVFAAEKKILWKKIVDRWINMKLNWDKLGDNNVDEMWCRANRN